MSTCSLEIAHLDPEIRGHVERGKDSLVEEFQGVFSAETIERYVSESLAELSGARFHDFVPLFVHRFARERLRALAQVEGKMTKEVPEVLFVCVHNAGRSQMAAGLLDQLADGRVHVRTAGSDPPTRSTRRSSRRWPRWGSTCRRSSRSRSPTRSSGAADAVITMGCGDACPIYPGKRYEDWELEDPDGEDLETVRRIRDQIAGRVTALLSDLEVPDTSARDAR